MDWNDVRVFLAVVRSGTVRGGARALRVDPATVSRRIAALERGLGARLFERASGRLALTASGRHLLQAGERADGALDEVSRRITGTDRRLGGVVRVTCPGSFTAFVAEALGAFARRHRAIEVEVSTMDVAVDVDGRQADVAVRVAEQPPERLVGRRVARLAVAIYASRVYLARHPEPIGDASHEWVEWDRRLAGKPAFAWIEKSYPRRQTALRGLSTADVAAAVESGIGLGALPCLLGDANSSLVRLADAPREVWSSVWLLTHEDLRPAARVRAVLDHLGTAIRSARGRMEGAPAPPVGAKSQASARRR